LLAWANISSPELELRHLEALVLLDLLALFEHFQQRLLRDFLLREGNLFADQLLLRGLVTIHEGVEQELLDFRPDGPAVRDTCEVGTDHRTYSN
jgi:hypothetical protein